MVSTPDTFVIDKDLKYLAEQLKVIIENNLEQMTKIANQIDYLKKTVQNKIVNYQIKKKNCLNIFSLEYLKPAYSKHMQGQH